MSRADGSRLTLLQWYAFVHKLLRERYRIQSVNITTSTPPRIEWKQTRMMRVDGTMGEL